MPGDLGPRGGRWLLLSCLEVQPAAKLSTYPRDTHTDTHTHTHTQRTPIWPVTQTATDRALPSTAPTYKTHIRCKPRQPRPLLLLGWQRQKVTSAAHTPHSPGSQAHAHSWIPRAPSQALCLPSTPAWILVPLTHPTGP